jgi:hypothetical protein
VLSTLERSRRVPIDRSGDRTVTLAAIAVASAFLGLALASFVLPPELRRGTWLPLHLALAGGASTAIAGVLPFFVAAFAMAPPAAAALRWAGVLAVATGASAVALGVVTATTALSVPGGIGFVAGIALVGAAALRPLVGALGPSRGIVTRAYVIALANVAVGATLGTLFLAGWPWAVDSWARLRPAHAWLNLVGFVSLVIATTLVHFLPTVVGTRIAAHPSGRVAVAALATGPTGVALGYAVGQSPLVLAGAVVTFVGALALCMYAVRVWSTHTRWSTDPGWHRFAIGGLGSAIGWFTIAIGSIGAETIASAAASSSRLIQLPSAPFIVGWVVQAILASATHLVPAIGPGDQAVHGRQRGILGVLAGPRLGSLNAGVAALTVGSWTELSQLVIAGTAAVAIPLAVSLWLFARAIFAGIESRRRPMKSPSSPHRQSH